MVGVAQLVERRSVAPNVAGSIPVSHPNFKTFVSPILGDRACSVLLTLAESAGTPGPKPHYTVRAA